MTGSIIKAERPYVLCGVGGPLLAFIYGLIGFHRELKSSFINPLWAPLLIPLFFLSPPLASLWLLKARKEPLNGQPKIGFQFYLLLQLLWWAILYALYSYISYKTSELLAIYVAEASLSKQLQIATPEQLRFSHALLEAYAVAGTFYIIGFVLIVCASFAKILNSNKPFTIALGAIWTNLPGLLLLICLSIAVFSMVEKYFAVLKLRYLESYILGKEAFKPDYWFIALRLYLYQALQFAFILVSAASLRIVSIRKLKA